MKLQESFLRVQAAIGQTAAAVSPRSNGYDTLTPLVSAWLTAVRSGTPPFSRSTRSGAGASSRSTDYAERTDCAFRRMPMWPMPMGSGRRRVTVASGQAVAATSLRVSAASVVEVEVGIR